MESEATTLEVPLFDHSSEDDREESIDTDNNAVTNFFSSKGTLQGYKDAIFLILFGFSLLIVCAIALTYGSVSLSNPGADYWIIGTDGVSTEDKAKEDIISKLMLGVLFILSLSTVVSLAWVYLLSYIAIFMVNAIIISLVVISVVGAITVLSLGYPSFGFLLLALALVTLLVSLFFQSRIEFASVNLDIACKAVVSMPSTIGYSLLMLLFQAAYVMIWCIASVGFATNDFRISKFFQGHEYTLDQCSSYSYSSTITVGETSLTCEKGECQACFCDGTLISNGACFTPRFYWSSMFGLLLALVWTNSVMVNVVHCTVVAAVARWWTTGTCTVEALQYFFGTFTSTSLGSICFGSLLGAVVRTMRAVTSFLHARVRRSTDNSFLGKVNRWSASVLDGLLAILDRMIVYFNRYAFCYVAIEEYDYIRASYAATTLFRARGFTALLNDDLLDFVMYISNTFIACVTMIAAYIFAKVVRLPTTYAYLLVIFGFFCGYVMGAVVLSTISSAITAVYVCFARDPAAFEAAHPHLYGPLSSAWSKIFPSAQQLRKVAGHDDEEAPSAGKKVRFSPSTGHGTQAFHGSYGGGGGAGGPTPVGGGGADTNLHQRELGSNSLGLAGRSGPSSVTGFWSSSLVQMVQNNIAKASSAASSALSGSGPGSGSGSTGTAYAPVQTNDNDEDTPPDNGGVWGTASAMTAMIVNRVPGATRQNATGNERPDGSGSTLATSSAETEMTSSQALPPTWAPPPSYGAARQNAIGNERPDGSGSTLATSSAETEMTSSQALPPTWAPPPSYAPFPAPSGGLHGGYGEYHLGYVESRPPVNDSSPPYSRSINLTGERDDEAELNMYAAM
jgi:hypothetical protein